MRALTGGLEVGRVQMAGWNGQFVGENEAGRKKRTPV
jgi:hypothetical protein